MIHAFVYLAKGSAQRIGSGTVCRARIAICCCRTNHRPQLQHATSHRITRQGSHKPDPQRQSSLRHSCPALLIPKPGVAGFQPEQSRYYQVELVQDMFSNWTLVQCWGGIGSNLGRKSFG
ncbi:hypothetical protein CKO29_16985 [Allochromatium vinosum]|nr:hypothetical protein [Allochromatium vinosum]